MTFFPDEAVRVSSDWWRDFTGQDPDTETLATKEQVVTVGGNFADAQLSIVSGLGRVDLVFQPSRPTDGDTHVAAQVVLPSYTLGPSDRLLEILLERIGSICRRLPTTKRVAVAGTFLKEVETLDQAYVELKSMLKSVNVQPTQMRELIFRVNWPVRIGNRTFNRIGVWAVVAITVQAIVPGMNDRMTMTSKHYVSFEFDFNTMPEPELKLSSEECEERIVQIVELVKENMKEGEVVST